MSNLRTIKLKSGDFKCTGNVCELLGGCGGMLPQKIFRSESLKMPFPALSGCVKIDPKIDCHFRLSNFQKALNRDRIF